MQSLLLMRRAANAHAWEIETKAALIILPAAAVSAHLQPISIPGEVTSRAALGSHTLPSIDFDRRLLMAKARPAQKVAVNSASDSEIEEPSLNLQSAHSAALEPETASNKPVDSDASAYPRRERLRARKAQQSINSKREEQHKPARHRHNGHKPSPLVLGCIAAAALATACVGWWIKRRKLKGRHQNVQHFITKCNLSPSEAVLTAVPPPPLLSTSFVTTAA